MSLLDFSPRIPLGTFSILHCIYFIFLYFACIKATFCIVLDTKQEFATASVHLNYMNLEVKKVRSRSFNNNTVQFMYILSNDIYSTYLHSL